MPVERAMAPSPAPFDVHTLDRHPADERAASARKPGQPALGVVRSIGAGR